MTQTLIRNAHVLTMDDVDTEFSRADILIENGRIQQISPDIDAPSAGQLGADGCLVTPGLVTRITICTRR